jgi:hypothetical protein
MVDQKTPPIEHLKSFIAKIRARIAPHSYWLRWVLGALVLVAFVIWFYAEPSMVPKQGRVIEYETGKPIAGAKVIMQYKGQKFNPVISQYGCWKVDVFTTDSDGYFSYGNSGDSVFPTFIYKPGRVSTYDDKIESRGYRDSRDVYAMKLDLGTTEAIVGDPGEPNFKLRSGLRMHSDPFGKMCGNHFRKRFRDWSWGINKHRPDAHDLGICAIQRELTIELLKRERDTSEKRWAFWLYHEAEYCEKGHPLQPSTDMDALWREFEVLVREQNK